MTAYTEKLKDPRWQKKRLQILERDQWCCQRCYDSDSTLHVHHLAYFGSQEPWDTDDQYLITLCESCHEDEKDSSIQEERLIEAMKSCGYLKNDFRSLAMVFENLCAEKNGTHLISPQMDLYEFFIELNPWPNALEIQELGQEVLKKKRQLQACSTSSNA